MSAGLSVVIPALDEAQALPLLLQDLARQTLAHEVVVTDGGSTDATRALAESLGARVILAPRGRGAQMNLGARTASGSRLLFLHADSRIESRKLLARASEALDVAQRKAPEVDIAGHFALQFQASEGAPRALLRFMQAKTRSNRPGTVNGDQGLLINRDFFDRLGGFDENLPFFEDQRIAARIQRQGRWMLLPGVIVTSFRRFEREGPATRYALMGLMMTMHCAGLESFFQRAPQLYVAQGKTAALDLAPFIRLAREVLIDEGWQAPRRLLDAGRFVRAQAWQLALMAELSGGDGTQEWFARRVEPRLDHPLADLLSAGLVAGAVFGLLPGWLRIREALKRNTTFWD